MTDHGIVLVPTRNIDKTKFKTLIQILGIRKHYLSSIITNSYRYKCKIVPFSLCPFPAFSFRTVRFVSQVKVNSDTVLVLAKTVFFVGELLL